MGIVVPLTAFDAVNYYGERDGDIAEDAVDAGPLTEGGRFERGMPSYCVRMNSSELIAALAQAVRL